jgi:hypothetical protein
MNTAKIILAEDTLAAFGGLAAEHGRLAGRPGE